MSDEPESKPLRPALGQRLHLNAAEPGRRMSELLKSIAADSTQERITIADLLSAMEGRAFGALLLLFAFPNILPSPPGPAGGGGDSGFPPDLSGVATGAGAQPVVANFHRHPVGDARSLCLACHARRAVDCAGRKDAGRADGVSGQPIGAKGAGGGVPAAGADPCAADPVWQHAALDCHLRHRFGDTGAGWRVDTGRVGGRSGCNGGGGRSGLWIGEIRDLRAYERILVLKSGALLPLRNAFPLYVQFGGR